jgi:hypothetical protein
MGGRGGLGRDWRDGKGDILVEHISHQLHFLFCCGDFLCRGGLGTPDAEHRHDCGCAGVGLKIGRYWLGLKRRGPW